MIFKKIKQSYLNYINSNFSIDIKALLIGGIYLLISLTLNFLYVFEIISFKSNNLIILFSIVSMLYIFALSSKVFHNYSKQNKHIYFDFKGFKKPIAISLYIMCVTIVFEFLAMVLDKVVLIIIYFVFIIFCIYHFFYDKNYVK